MLLRTEVEDFEHMVDAYVQLAKYGTGFHSRNACIDIVPDDLRTSISAVDMLKALLQHTAQDKTVAIVAIEGIRDLAEHREAQTCSVSSCTEA